MKNNTYLHQLNIPIQSEIKTGVILGLLVNVFFGLLFSIIANAMEPSWDFSIRDGMLLTIINTGVFMLAIFIGIMLIGLGLATWKKILSNKLAIVYGFTIGTIAVIVGDYILWNLFFQPNFRNFETLIGQFLPVYFLPSIANILIIANLGRKMNYSESHKQI